MRFRVAVAGRAAAAERAHQHLRAVRPPRRGHGDVRAGPGAGARRRRAARGDDVGRGPVRRAAARSCSSSAWQRSGARPDRSPNTRTSGARGAARAAVMAGAAWLFALLLAAAVARGRARRQGRRTVPAVIEDPNYKVRVQAALVLGRLGDPRGCAAAHQGAGRPEQDRARHRGRRRWASWATRRRPIRCATSCSARATRSCRAQAEKARRGAERRRAAGTTSGREDLPELRRRSSGGVKSAGPDASKIIARRAGAGAGQAADR